MITYPIPMVPGPVKVPEAVLAAMAVDDDGRGLYTTGLGHGDAMHLADLDPHVEQQQREGNLGLGQAERGEFACCGNDGFGAVRADRAQQALCPDTIERRRQGIRIDAQVREAAEHIEDVVGVHRREHQVPGQGGCGPVCGCRDSDCGGGPVPTGNPPTPVVTPEPTPPPDCPAPGEVREWINLIPPKLTFAGFKPDHPVVVEQDPDKQGFQMHITGTGGRYEHKTQRLEKVCDDQPEPINGTPQPCREWHYECPIRCAECYNDPFAGIQVRMRLADSTMEWIQGELASRYTGAEPKEGLPRTWQLPGVYGQMSVDQWWIYAPGKPDILSNGPLDPGIHGGKIVGWTTGTPKSAPQRVAAPFAVPVYLLDTTIGQ